LLEQANGGVLYLDEVADMPPGTQSKILRVLVDQTFTRVGGSARIKVDLRVISSTTRDLRGEIAAGRFRQELYDRLNVVPIAVPSLAERREDIPALAEHFFARHSSDQGLSPPEISLEAMAALQTYDWPGNVRQLRNVVERTVIMTPRERLTVVEPGMLPAEVTGRSMASNRDTISGMMAVPLREARESFEREYLSIQIRRFSGNISRTATFIGMERSALHRKLKLLGMAERREGMPEDGD
jgi:two-component system nitrogen regulation response regulator NtrX